MQYQMEFALCGAAGRSERSFSKWYNSREELALKWMEISMRYNVRAICIHERKAVVNKLDF